MDEQNKFTEETSAESLHRVEIIDANGTKVLNIMSALTAFKRDGLAQKLAPMKDHLSICSGDPGIRYCHNEVDLVLTPDETYRLVMRALTPKEFFAIYQTVGDIYEIHNDFYNPDTGEAFQPAINIPQTDFDDENDVLFFALPEEDFYSYNFCLRFAFDSSIPYVNFNYLYVELNMPEFHQALAYNPHITRAVVVFSQEFFDKPWTDKVFQEVNELVNRNITILPVWHGVSEEAVIERIPALSGVKGLTAPKSDPEIIKEFYRFADSIAMELDGGEE